MAHDATSPTRFDTSTALALEATFDGGKLTTDGGGGGLPWLAQLDSEMGLCESLAACVPEWRRGGAVTHSLSDPVRQRVSQMACGYEDQDDADLLRSDPLFKLACGRLPETGRDLASQPTLSRLENAPDLRACYRMARALLELYVRRRGENAAPPRRGCSWTSTRPTRSGPRRTGGGGLPRLLRPASLPSLVGLRCRHRPDRQRGLTRPGNAHARRGALCRSSSTSWRGLERAVARSEDREIRADAGFALPAIYEYCEDEGIYYTIGLVPNPRLEDSAAPLVVFLGDAHLDALRMRHGMAANKVRLLSSEVGYEAGSRGKKRRVVYKAEVLEEGTNTRFVVTNRLEEAPLERALRALRPERRNGESHKGLQKRIAGGDRLSCGKFWANQFRLLLHAAAYWLLDVLRERLLVRRDIRRMQLDTLRLRVVKIGGVGYASC